MMSVFYCRCGARLEGASARFAHRCDRPSISSHPSAMVDEFGFAWRIDDGEIQYKAPDCDWRNLHNLFGEREIPITTERAEIIQKVATQ